MKDIARRAMNMREALEDYQEAHGGRYVLWMLPDDSPLPAPRIGDLTLLTEDVMVVVAGGNTKKEDTDE